MYMTSLQNTPSWVGRSTELGFRYTIRSNASYSRPPEANLSLSDPAVCLLSLHLFLP